MSTFIISSRRVFPVVYCGLFCYQVMRPAMIRTITTFNHTSFRDASAHNIWRVDAKDENDSGGKTMSDTAKETVGNFFDKVGQAMKKGKELKDRAGETYEKVKEKAEEVKEKAGERYEQVKEKAVDFKEGGKECVSWARETVEHTKDALKHNQAKEKVEEVNGKEKVHCQAVQVAEDAKQGEKKDEAVGKKQ